MRKSLTNEQENSINLKSFVMTLGSYYTILLSVMFSLVDFIFYRELFFDFILLRISIVISIFAINKVLKSFNNLNYGQVQVICSVPFIFCALSIYYMIIRINDPFTTYWAGLAIVAAGLSIGFTFSWRYYLSIMLIIVLPFFVITTIFYLKSPNISYFLNPIFLVSISVVCVTGRWFYTRLSNSEYLNRKQLAEEVESRNKIIEEKTAESVRLNALSKQFSPQIIQGIKTGQISLGSKVHRSEICAIFVDIKDSTFKFSTLDRDDLQKIIAMYMEDVMGIFLKYDITIDKFLGDGVMGFTNDPVLQSDYLERAILAAIEVNNKIKHKQEVYSRFWGSEFEIRIGLSSGYASVGFYGSDRHVKSYTAIGRVINLASRLNGAAPANGIAISGEIFSKIQENNSQFFREYKIADLGFQELKGFEKEKIKILTIDKVISQLSELDEESCPHGHGPLMIAQLENGIYAMKCRYCDFILEDAKIEEKAA